MTLGLCVLCGWRSSLAFGAEGTDVGTRRQCLAALPAELRLHGLARFEAGLDFLYFFRGRRRRGWSRTPRALDGCGRRGASGKHGVEQIGGALVPRRDIRGD